MCGRYASSRKPEDLVEEFEIDKVEVKEPLAPDFNVAPTKQVYAVVQRPTDAEEPGDKQGPAERQLRTLRWGLVPFWAKDPGIGNKMINARMETVAREAGVPAAVRLPALPAAGRRLLRVVPHRAAEREGEAGQAAVLHPARRRRRARDGRALRDLEGPHP